jgi:hypothetical protein
MCHIRDRLDRAVVRGVPSQEAVTHFVLDEVGVPGKMAPGAGAR